MNCYIVTGASRGLGLGFARIIAAQGDQLIAIARQESAELAAIGANSAGYRFIALDLAASEMVTTVADDLFGSLAGIDWQGIYLINNAGLVEPIAPAGRYGDADLLQCLNVNLSATMQLGNAFIRHLQDRASDKRILNISSGAGRNAYPSWSAYCTAKAGVDMYSRCVGVEQANLPHGIRIASVAPGIIDTGMQTTIRSSSPDDFPMVAQFAAYKAAGDLADADTRAGDLLKLLHSDHLQFGDVLNIRDFIA